MKKVETKQRKKNFTSNAARIARGHGRGEQGVRV
jgi:hypothetical protein